MGIYDQFMTDMNDIAVVLKARENKYKGKGLYRDGTKVHSNLPNSYHLSTDKNRVCKNCSSYSTDNQQRCSKWEAVVRAEYICRDWRSSRLNKPKENEPKKPSIGENSPDLTNDTSMTS